VFPTHCDPAAERGFAEALPKPHLQGGAMKSLSWLFFAVLLLHAEVAPADDMACRQAYSRSLNACARSLDMFDPNGRAGAQRACVDGARLTQAYCMSESNACLNDGLAAYDHSLAACEAEFDTAVCAGEMVCEQVIAQQRDNCLSYTVTMLDVSTAACGTR
jgi:hypothetical protein